MVKTVIFAVSLDAAYILSCYNVVWRRCSWWAISFTVGVNGVLVDPRILPMNRINSQSLQLPSPMFRVLDADPMLGSFIDAVQGFTLTFTEPPTFSDLRLIRDAIIDYYRSGDVMFSAFTARSVALRRYAMASCPSIRPSVRPSVCPSNVGGLWSHALEIGILQK